MKIVVLTTTRYHNPVINLLREVKAKVSGLNNLLEARHTAQHNLDWNNILEQAECLYKEQVNKGFV